jgi:hypothetical protein
MHTVAALDGNNNLVAEQSRDYHPCEVVARSSSRGFSVLTYSVKVDTGFCLEPLRSTTVAHSVRIVRIGIL